jgi:hypothetical protein
MTLTLKAISKNGRSATYTGAARVVRFPVDAFPDSTPPPHIEVAAGTFAEPKPVLTAEEKAAIRAARPKPTEAELVARAEARLARRKAKLAEAATEAVA